MTEDQIDNLGFSPKQAEVLRSLIADFMKEINLLNGLVVQLTGSVETLKEQVAVLKRQVSPMAVSPPIFK